MNFSQNVQSTIKEVRELVINQSFTKADWIRECLTDLTELEVLWVACSSIDHANESQLRDLRAAIQVSGATSLEGPAKEILSECRQGHHDKVLLKLSEYHPFDAFAFICLIAGEIGFTHVDKIKDLIRKLDESQISLSA